MKIEKSNQEIFEPSNEEKIFPSPEGGFIKKMGAGYYRAFREDGTELRNATIPINICLMALYVKLLAVVRVCPSKEDIAMESALETLRDAYLEGSGF